MLKLYPLKQIELQVYFVNYRKSFQGNRYLNILLDHTFAIVMLYLIKVSMLLSTKSWKLSKATQYEL